MLHYVNKTSIGYSHLRSGTICQDYSATYHDEERTIITACDGHGGDIYVRSHLGSKFASKSAMKVFWDIEKSIIHKYKKNDISEKIKLSILCEWNTMVDQSLSEKALSKKEIESLTEDKIFRLEENPPLAYGTTLNAAMIYGDKLICVSLGDGGIFLLRDGTIEPAFFEDEEMVGNLTYSMCSEDAYRHMNVEIIDFNEYDGVLLCTDGLINPYQNFNNFTKSFVKPITLKMLDERYFEINNFIEKIGTEIGTGDDVSFSMILKSNIKRKIYKR